MLSASPLVTKTSHPAVYPTTFVEAPALSALLGAKIIFADETKQPTGSFKFRAAYNVAAYVQQTHIIASSSGNFAQALSYACSLMGKRCTIVMPIKSAQVKVDGIKKYGGQIEFVDTDKKGRAERLAELAEQNPDAYITNAYDNPLIIEGTKSLGKDIASNNEHFDYVISPIGGGGLISGIISGIKESERTKTTVIGAEPEIANDASLSLKAGRLIANTIEPQTIADGARTISLGKHNWEIVRHNLRQIIEVPDEKIKAAVKMIYDHLQLKAEPTGALSFAAILTETKMFKNKSVCCVISGGNVDEQVFQSLIENR